MCNWLHFYTKKHIDTNNFFKCIVKEAWNGWLHAVKSGCETRGRWAEQRWWGRGGGLCYYLLLILYTFLSVQIFSSIFHCDAFILWFTFYSSSTDFCLLQIHSKYPHLMLAITGKKNKARLQRPGVNLIPSWCTTRRRRHMHYKSPGPLLWRS